MLAYLRQHVALTLAAEPRATVSAGGPAGLQALNVPCAADGLRLLLLVPPTTDLLVNLDAEGAVVVTTDRWQAWGRARVLEAGALPSALAGLAVPDAALHAVVEVQLSRVTIAHAEGWGAAETIDLEDGSAAGAFARG